MTRFSFHPDHTSIFHTGDDLDCRRPDELRLATHRPSQQEEVRALEAAMVLGTEGDYGVRRTRRCRLAPDRLERVPERPGRCDPHATQAQRQRSADVVSNARRGVGQ